MMFLEISVLTMYLKLIEFVTIAKINLTIPSHSDELQMCFSVDFHDPSRGNKLSFSVKVSCET